jgi:MerR family transcriptional regulator, light-induced transcriptional regulator
MAVQVYRTPRGRLGKAAVPALVQALLQEDVAAAYALCDDFAQRSGSRVTVFADLIQMAMLEVAEMWYQGAISAAREAAAADLVAAVVERLPPTPVLTSVPLSGRCLLLLHPGERHTLGSRMLALALEDEGWTVDSWSGPDWARCLEPLSTRPLPRFVGISAAAVPSVLGLTRAIQAIRARGVPVLVGGAAFNRSPELWRQVGASGHGPDARVGAVLARACA